MPNDPNIAAAFPDEDDVTVYVCGGPEAGKSTVGREIQRMLLAQGYTVEFRDEHPVNSPVEHFQKLRALKDRLTSVRVRAASFPSQRFKELVDREAEQKDPPAMLTRIHWGEDCFSSKIDPEQRYLVKCVDGAWYTGRFIVRTSGSKPHWSLVETDGREFLDGSPVRDLTKESQRNGIVEIYQIVK